MRRKGSCRSNWLTEMMVWLILTTPVSVICRNEDKENGQKNKPWFQFLITFSGGCQV